MKAILIRVGIDQTFGEWNAPCNPATGDYVYVPIPEVTPNTKGSEKYYSVSVVPAIRRFSELNSIDLTLPAHLNRKRMHLDPDFDYLTYGDTDNRGRRLLDFVENDLVVFYSSMRSMQGGTGLIYALIGLYVVDSIRRVKEIRAEEYDENAHTRYRELNEADIIVKAKPGVSGRFKKFIPVGEFRNKSYRVKQNILDEWGGLSVNDGWIQRSVVPPLFLNAEKFMRWLENKSPGLIASNN